MSKLLFDQFCWFCHRDCASKLICPKCKRNYHLSCITEYRHHLEKGPDNLKRFTDVCPECRRIDEGNKRWNSGHDFEPIKQKTTNTLLGYILEVILLLKETPGPFKWAESRFRSCFNPIDVNIIKKRINECYYVSPQHFVSDIHLINHNCTVIWHNARRLKTEQHLVDELLDYESRAVKFRKQFDKKICFLEDCPHCVWNFVRCRNNEDASENRWLTMACPWGHPLIMGEIGNEILPIKLIKFNRESERLDVIVFGSSISRLHASNCWLPSKSDLEVSESDAKTIKKAKQQANEYIKIIEKRFKMKLPIGRERKSLKDLRSPFINRDVSREIIDDVIELTDDEAPDEPSANSSNPPPQPQENNKQDEAQETIGTNLFKSEPMETDSDTEVSSDSHSAGRTDGLLDVNEDLVIDEVNAVDESSSDSKKSIPVDNLTTIIEILPPDPELNNETPIKMPPKVVEPAPAEVTTPLVPDENKSFSLSPHVPDPDKLIQSDPQLPEPTPQSLEGPDPISSTLSSSAFPPKIPLLSEIPIQVPLSTSESLTLSSAKASSLTEQFAIVSDDEIDDHGLESPNIEFNSSTSSDNYRSFHFDDFVVEDDQNMSDCNPNFGYQSLSLPQSFSCVYNDTVFESTIKVDMMERLEWNEPDPNGLKRFKLDQNVSDHTSSILTKLEKQLEVTEAENQLQSQQIDALQEQLRLQKNKGEAKWENIKIKLNTQIDRLKEELECEKKLNEQTKKSLSLSVESGNQFLAQSEQRYKTWQLRFENTLKTKVDQHKIELDAKIEEIERLKVALDQKNVEKMDMEQKFQTLQSKYNRMMNRFKSISRDFDDDDNTSSTSSALL